VRRVAVFHDTFDPGHPVEPLLQAFAAQGVELVHTPRGDMSGADPADYDAVVVFVRFRYLRAGPPLDWRGFTGTRALLEHDAVQNYSHIAGGHFLRAWPAEIARHGFDLTIVSGREVARRLEADGVRASWVPKGYDERRFHDEGRARSGICHFGKRYPARAAMLRHLRRSGVDVQHVAAPPEELNAVLNRYASCVVCNMEGAPALGALGRALQRVAPGALVTVRPGLEPMIKNFEVAASGCTPFFDAIPELAELGFVDGETAFVYSDFDELAERVRGTPPEELREVGRRAARLARDRHTWSHRVRQILDALG
jgi:glycosyltransferase involved in cell wall biosynthesis